MKPIKTVLFILALSLCGFAQNASFTSPANGAQIAYAGNPTNVTFTWSPSSSLYGSYGVGIYYGGTCAGTLTTSGNTTGTSITLGLPSSGSVCAVLTWRACNCQAVYATTVQFTLGNFQTPSIALPVPGSVLTGPSVTFTWNAGSSTNMQLAVGTTDGGSDIAVSPGGASTSFTTAVPTNGATIYARLWYIGANGQATFNLPDATYTEASASMFTVSDTMNSTNIVQPGTPDTSLDDYDPTIPIPPPPNMPAPGAINVPASNTTIQNGSITFSWNPANPPYYLSLSFYNYGYTDAGSCFGVTATQCTINITGTGTMFGSLVWYDTSGNIQATSGTWTVTAGSGGSHIMSLTKQVRTTHGVIDMPRGDILNIGKVSYAFEQNAAGGWNYSYTMATNEVAMIRIGDGRYDITGDSHPANWSRFNGPGFAPLKSPERSDSGTFMIASSWLPGLVALNIQNDWMGLDAAMEGKARIPGASPLIYSRTGPDNGSLAAAASVNGITKYAIGPAFRVGITKNEVMKAVANWVVALPFLKPLTTGGTVQDLQPSNQLENDVVICLRSVLN